MLTIDQRVLPMVSRKSLFVIRVGDQGDAALSFVTKKGIELINPWNQQEYLNGLCSFATRNQAANYISHNFGKPDYEMKDNEGIKAVRIENRIFSIESADASWREYILARKSTKKLARVKA